MSHKAVCTIATLLLLMLALPVSGGGKRVIASSSRSGSESPFQQPEVRGDDEAACPDPQFGSQRNSPVSKLCEDMRKNLNKARHESLKKDTDRLFTLATELKNSVDKSSENTLSLDVIKKAEEVEKLAKKVKEKMKG